jgi:hypothetical protein
MADLPPPDYARNMCLIGHCDQGGRGDGLQIMVHRGFAYVAHPWSVGFSIIDVQDPKRPGKSLFFAAPRNTWSERRDAAHSGLHVLGLLGLPR